MLLGETLSQQHIVGWSRKGYVNDAIGVNVSDLCCPEQEFLPAKAMGVNRDSRPTRDYAFERLQVLHYYFSDCFSFDVSMLPLDSASDLP